MVAHPGFPEMTPSAAEADDAASKRTAAVATVDERPEPTESPKRLLSASSLLKKARRHRLAGEWSDVRKTYRALVNSYPNSEQAKIALVAWANLEIERFAKPKDALTLFDRYLKSSHGQLRQEAMWGRARALGALGRKADERVVLEQYIDLFPSDPKRAAAEARLDILKKASPN